MHQPRPRKNLDLVRLLAYPEPVKKLASFVLGAMLLSPGSTSAETIARGGYAVVVDNQAVAIGKLTSGSASTPPPATRTSRTARRGSTTHPTVTFAMNPASRGAMTAWVEASLGPKPPRKTGEFRTLDDRNLVTAKRTFSEAWIGEVKFPALDATGKETAELTVRIDAPAFASQRSLSRTRVRLSNTPPTLAANFRIEIDGLPTENVVSVDQITWTRKGVSNLRVVLSMSHWDAWVAVFKAAIYEGNSSTASELSATITLLAADQKTELGKVELSDMLPWTIKPPTGEVGDKVATFEAEFQVGSIRYDDRR